MEMIVSARQHYKNFLQTASRASAARQRRVSWDVAAAQRPVAIPYKTSAFDNDGEWQIWEKPLQDNDLTDSIEVNS